MLCSGLAGRGGRACQGPRAPHARTRLPAATPCPGGEWRATTPTRWHWHWHPAVPYQSTELRGDGYNNPSTVPVGNTQRMKLLRMGTGQAPPWRYGARFQAFYAWEEALARSAVTRQKLRLAVSRLRRLAVLQCWISWAAAAAQGSCFRVAVSRQRCKSGANLARRALDEWRESLEASRWQVSERAVARKL